MPYIHVKQNDFKYNASSFDLYGDDHNNYKKLDMDKLQNYINIVIDIRIRKKNETFSSDQNVYKPFKICKNKDFTSRNYDGDEQFVNSVS